MPLPSEILNNKFEHDPTPSQRSMFLEFDQFIDSKEPKATFVLKGYAGTGKTSIVATLVKVLPLFNYKYILLAPTGRAAKVISQYATKSAFTIHKKIYMVKGGNDETGPTFKNVKNYHSHTIFIVDEASMIASGKDYAGADLLNDLIQFVFESDTNKLILVGDVAQLPPVGQTFSHALDGEYLKSNYDLSVFSASLTEITRQAANSGILLNATAIRDVLSLKDKNIHFNTQSYQDIFKMTSGRMEDGLRYAYEKFGIENTIIICRSNKSAVGYNHYIRNSLMFKEEELDAGDLIMIARNNYCFATEQISSGFLANGDFAEVLKIKKTEELHGLRFADLVLKLVDYPDAEPIEAKVMLDVLHSHTPALNREDDLKLYKSVLIDYADLPKKKQKEELKKDPYLNALQIKYAYALTCHKSQGGQWEAVFVDQGYLGDKAIDDEFVRWVYTAMTRAKKELFLVNFETKFY